MCYLPERFGRLLIMILSDTVAPHAGGEEAQGDLSVSNDAGVYVYLYTYIHVYNYIDIHIQYIYTHMITYRISLP